MHWFTIDIIIIAMTGAIAAFIGKIVEIFIQLRKKEETIEDRIQKLTISLREAAKFISEIESEISARSMLAEKLQKDISIFKTIAKLKSPEIEAINQLLRGELEKEGKKSFWKGFAVNFAFFILGAITSGVITILLK
jgi:hypothetical protein